MWTTQNKAARKVGDCLTTFLFLFLSAGIIIINPSMRIREATSNHAAGNAADELGYISSRRQLSKQFILSVFICLKNHDTGS